MSCGSLNPAHTHIVVGGTDHVLYEVQLATGRRTRTLYTKSFGQGAADVVRHVIDTQMGPSILELNGNLDAASNICKRNIPIARRSSTRTLNPCCLS
jgi:hypothetical protein